MKTKVKQNLQEISELAHETSHLQLANVSRIRLLAEECEVELNGLTALPPLSEAEHLTIFDALLYFEEADLEDFAVPPLITDRDHIRKLAAIFNPEPAPPRNTW